MISRLWSITNVCILTLGVVTTVDAALISRLGGQAVYDTEQDITWMADSNLAATNRFGVAIPASGFMTWSTANDWISGMNAENYLGFNDWRLPVSVFPDAGCSVNGSGTEFTAGMGCTASELDHLFYNGIGATAGGSILNGDPTELAKFSNVQSNGFWTATGFLPSFPNHFWSFDATSGNLSVRGGNSPLFAWAVRNGDVVSAVPVPAASWLLFSGLLGLIGIARREK